MVVPASLLENWERWAPQLDTCAVLAQACMQGLLPCGNGCSTTQAALSFEALCSGVAQLPNRPQVTSTLHRKVQAASLNGFSALPSAAAVGLGVHAVTIIPLCAAGSWSDGVPPSRWSSTMARTELCCVRSWTPGGGLSQWSSQCTASSRDEDVELRATQGHLTWPIHLRKLQGREAAPVGVQGQNHDLLYAGKCTHPQ